MWTPALLMCFCTVVFLCAAITSNIRRDFFLKNPPLLIRKHLSVQVCITSIFIQPFLLQTTTTPAGKVSLGMVILLKITIGLSFPPAAVHANTTVKFVQFMALSSDRNCLDPLSRPLTCLLKRQMTSESFTMLMMSSSANFSSFISF